MSTTQLVLVSSADALLAAAAAVDAGLLDRPRRRVLVSFGRAPAPETAMLPHERPGLAPAVGRFDDVVVLDELVQPLDPTRWSPRGDDRPVLERLLRGAWGIGDDTVVIVADRPHAEQPVEWLMSAFYGCEVVRLVTDLAGYGPAPQPLGWPQAQRTSRYLYREHVKGLKPWPEGAEHHPEQGVDAVAIPDDAWSGLLDEVVTAADAVAPGPREGRTALVLAESFVTGDLLSRDEETALWREAVEAAVAEGVDEVVVLADPVVPANLATRLTDLDTGAVRVTLVERPAPAEAYLLALRPDVVIGTMSPTLLRARAEGARVVPVGTKLVKERLRPYANPARLPWAVADAALREDGRWSAAGDLESLVRAVAFCMYPDRFEERRTAVTSFLEALEPAEVGRYTTANRAQKLGLLPVPEPADEAEPEPVAQPTAPAPESSAPRGEGWFRAFVRKPR
ncbi:alpha-2,8-polysialyltransferase family protein [Promicromonospora xylanilytica]